jgi:two-component system KDP operon response regulator KdpE
MREFRVLVVDDDPAILRLLELNLTAENYRVQCAASGRAGFDLLHTWHPDVVILDLILPDMDGMKLCQRVREVSDVPVIVLTARKDEKYLVQSLDAGADDYVAKPFRREELLARLRAVMRRTNIIPAEEYSSEEIVRGEITLNCKTRQLTIGEQHAKLSHTEFKLLYLLVTHANKLLTYDELVSKVWGPEFTGDTERLRTYIRYLRQKMESDPKSPKHIITEHGIGYMFIG